MISRRSVASLLSAATLTATLCFPAKADAQRTTLAGNVPAAVQTARVLGALAPTQQMSLALVLPLRNQSGLTDLLRGLYDPADPRYGHYLTPAEFDAAYGPTPADYQAAIDFAVSQGLQVTHTWPGRTLLDVAGPASAVQAAFGVNILRYQSADGTTFYAPDRDPSVSANLAGIVTGVVGLDSATRFTPGAQPVSPLAYAGAAFPAVAGTGPQGGLSPSDTKKIYELTSVSQTGSGQTAAVFELDGYAASDIQAFETLFGISGITIQNVLVDSYSGAAGNNQAEVVLDIDMLMELAPHLSKILVYEAQNGGPQIVDEYQRIADDDLAEEVSSSWGAIQLFAASWQSSENTSFQKMAADGQSVFICTGDAGAYANQNSLAVWDAASQPYAVAVGATDIRLNNGNYSSETSWGDTQDTRQYPAGTGSGGGISSTWGIPSWQQGHVSTNSLGSTTMRNTPDVSLYGDYDTGGYSIYLAADPNGPWVVYNGTSAATPLWASFTALVNQARAANGLPTAGFLDPAIYKLASSSRYAADFHDVNDGSTNLFYPAVTGYDLSTGWGSFHGASLLADLSQAAPAAPTGLLATAGNSQVSLTWNASTGATSYNIYRSTTSDGEGNTAIANVTTASFMNTGLTNGTTYYYKIDAQNSVGKSGQTGEVSAKPVAPSTGIHNLLVFQNGIHGAEWSVTGVTVTKQAAISPNLPSPWNIVGVGDFGNGQNDLVFQNQSTGQVAIWMMNGSKYASSALTSKQPPVSGWRVAAVADMNGDGKPDLIFQNTSNGNLAVWIMSGATVVSEVGVSTLPTSAWRLVGVGDYNGDGKNDFVFQNNSTRQIDIWYMNGATRIGNALLNVVPPAGWPIVSIAKLSGNAEPDMVFQNGGLLAEWSFVNLSRTADKSLPSAPTGWNVVAPH